MWMITYMAQLHPLIGAFSWYDRLMRVTHSDNAATYQPSSTEEVLIDRVIGI